MLDIVNITKYFLYGYLNFVIFHLHQEGTKERKYNVESYANNRFGAC